jgi:hypothetical protein
MENQKCGSYIMEYYSALNTKEILRHATTWISEKSQPQKDKYCMVSLT